MKQLWLILTVLIWASSSLCPGGEPSAPATQPLSSDAMENELFEYKGDIDQTLKIGMSLRFGAAKQSAKGCYFYEKYCKDIRVESIIVGRSVVIREYDADGRQTGQFEGEFVKVDPRSHFHSTTDLQREVIVGEWSKPGGAERKPFYLSLDFSVHLFDGESRYDGFGDQTAVDRFASDFRNAVLAHDVKRVAGMIQFPIHVTMDGVRKTIVDPAQFKLSYDTIVTKKYVDRIQAAVPCHMFSNYQGVMIGRGEAWIGAVERDSKTVPRIIAINN